MELGQCPTGQHRTDYRQCGYWGCVNLEPWATKRHYKWHYEQSYKAESNLHVRGDGRWFVEVLCKNGLIYPYGGTTLCCYVKPGVRARIEQLAVEPHQTDGKAAVYKFDVTQLDQVAAIMRPRKRRTITLSLEQIEKRRLTLQRVTEARKSSTSDGPNQPKIDPET